MAETQEREQPVVKNTRLMLGLEAALDNRCQIIEDKLDLLIESQKQHHS